MASTKAYTTSVVDLYLLTCSWASCVVRSIDNPCGNGRYLARLPDLVGVCWITRTVRELAESTSTENFLYLGRGINYPTALEGALKLKEISYIHAEAIRREMKHADRAHRREHACCRRGDPR